MHTGAHPHALPEETALDAGVLARLDAWAEGRVPPLRRAWEALRARLRLDQGYFLHPLALPVLQAPVWAAQGLGLPADRGERGADAAAAGYLHVRIQDDLLDEGVDPGPAGTMLAEALLFRHTRLCWELAEGDAGFPLHFEQAWSIYAGAMALEAELAQTPRAVDQALFFQLLGRSAPLSLPPLAVMAGRATRADRQAVVGALDLLAQSHQLLTDCIDLEKDLELGRPSWLLSRFGGGGEDGVPVGKDALRRRVFLEGGLDTVQREARATLDQALLLAGTQLPGLEGWHGRRTALMQKLHQDVFSSLFGWLLDPKRVVP